MDGKSVGIGVAVGAVCATLVGGIVIGLSANAEGRKGQPETQVRTIHQPQAPQHPQQAQPAQPTSWSVPSFQPVQAPVQPAQPSQPVQQGAGMSPDQAWIQQQARQNAQFLNMVVSRLEGAARSNDPYEIADVTVRIKGSIAEAESYFEQNPQAQVLLQVPVFRRVLTAMDKLETAAESLKLARTAGTAGIDRDGRWHAEFLQDLAEAKIEIQAVENWAR